MRLYLYKDGVYTHSELIRKNINPDPQKKLTVISPKITKNQYLTLKNGTLDIKSLTYTLAAKTKADYAVFDSKNGEFVTKGYSSNAILVNYPLFEYLGKGFYLENGVVKASEEAFERIVLARLDKLEQDFDLALSRLTKRANQKEIDTYESQLNDALKIRSLGIGGLGEDERFIIELRLKDDETPDIWSSKVLDKNAKLLKLYSAAWIGIKRRGTVRYKSIKFGDDWLQQIQNADNALETDKGDTLKSKQFLQLVNRV